MRVSGSLHRLYMSVVSVVGQEMQDDDLGSVLCYMKSDDSKLMPPSS